VKPEHEKEFNLIPNIFVKILWLIGVLNDILNMDDISEIKEHVADVKEGFVWAFEHLKKLQDELEKEGILII